MNLFFVYDTAYCKADEDDPKDAIVYFFPVQTSESQRYLLCCQLAGVAKFLKSTFSTPSIISLDQGKFALRWSGNYLLVIGANSDVNSSTLQDQLSFLCDIFCFYHGSINNVLKDCKNSRDELLVKLELAWSRYVTLSQCFGNVFQLSLNSLPLKPQKKNTGIVATANQLLHTCQLNSSVIAGCVFYNNRVLSTQFMPQLTNYLSLFSNANASAPVSSVQHSIQNLPPDVELKYVYLSPVLISKIIKYNHICVGSRIRVKTSSKIQSLAFKPSPYKEHFSSGSEGDIDSGNCSESVGSYKDVSSPNFSRKSKRCASLRSCRHKKFCTEPGFAGYVRLFNRNLLISRNLCLSTLMDTVYNDVKKIGKVEEDSGIHAKVESIGGFVCERGIACGAINLPCTLHAGMWASDFISRSNSKHTNLTSTCDSEFRCSMCTNYSSICVDESSLKRWNSDVDISDYNQYQCICGLPTLKSGDVQPREHTLRSLKPVSPKIQVLRCRSNSDTSRRFHRTRHGIPFRRHIVNTSVASHSKSIELSDRQRLFPVKTGDPHFNIETNELQKHVLYVQRYGCSTLVLLLNSGYDEKVISYLWNCVFNILRDLECSHSEKQQMEHLYELEPPFYMLLYNHIQRILKEYPEFPSLHLTEKHSTETVQKIKEDFLTDPYLQTMCLLSNSQSIFAYHKDQHLAFYLQPESSLRNLEALYTLNKKAIRRLGKCFKMTL